jgi:hypothetical protein
MGIMSNEQGWGEVDLQRSNVDETDTCVGVRGVLILANEQVFYNC